MYEWVCMAFWRMGLGNSRVGVTAHDFDVWLVSFDLVHWTPRVQLESSQNVNIFMALVKT